MMINADARNCSMCNVRLSLVLVREVSVQVSWHIVIAKKGDMGM